MSTGPAGTPPAEPIAPAAPPRCRNCGGAVPDRFCGACGQEAGRSLRIPFHRLAGEALGETFSVDSKLARTLLPLLLRPGAMTRAWLEGRRASHTSPVKLYLVFSFLFFLAGALAPEAAAVRLGRAGEDDAVQIDDASLAALRASGAFGARLAGRLEELRALPPGELRRQVGGALEENVPKAMFVLVPALALFLSVLYRRASLYLAEHAVFALHTHAVAFLLALPGAALGNGRAQTVGFWLAAAHGVAALRGAYGGGWWSAVWRGAVAGLLYLVALGLALAAAAAAALLVG